MIDDDRKLEIRHKMWEMARELISFAARRQAMPVNTEEEDEYAREFLQSIADATKPGNYREPDDLPEGWCEQCGEDIGLESHYHCATCGEICSLAGHPECDYATIKPISVTVYIPGPDGLVLGVSRRGRPTEFGLPGGKVDPGEGFAQAAVRELKEETGLTLTNPMLIYSDISPGEVTYRNHVFRGDISGDIVPEEGTVVRMVTWEELFAGPFGEYNRRFHKSLGL